MIPAPVDKRSSAERWVALDLETTGLSPTRHEIRELAVVPVGINDQTEHVLRFTRADFQASARTRARARLSTLTQMIGEGSVLVAHNAAFDLAFLAEALRRAQVRHFALRAYCTLRLARKLLPEVARYDLASLTKTLGIDSGKPHAALADARAVAALFVALAERAGFVDEEALRAVHGPPLQVQFRSAATSAPQ